jgi:hypothetical protein
LRLGIEARTCLPLLFYELAKTWHHEFAGLFSLFVCEVAERLEEYACGLFIGLRGFGKRALKFCFCRRNSVGYSKALALRTRALLAVPLQEMTIPAWAMN